MDRSLKGTLQLLSIVLCATFALVGTVVLRDCAPGKGIPEKNLITVLNVSMTNCTDEPCVFVKKSTYESYVKAVFNFTADATNKLIYTTSALFATGPFVVSKDDLCEQLKIGACTNITPGYELEARLTRFFGDFIPDYDGDLRFQISKDQEPVFCAQLKVSIKGRPVTTQGLTEALSGGGGVAGGFGG